MNLVSRSARAVRLLESWMRRHTMYCNETLPGLVELQRETIAFIKECEERPSSVKLPVSEEP